MQPDTVSTEKCARTTNNQDTVSRVPVVQITCVRLTPNDQLKANVRALLKARDRTPEELVRWCRNSLNWFEKIYAEKRRTFPVKYYESLATFFGIEVYQLFQPGIADRSERRSGSDRRKQMDRRVSRAVLSEKALDVDLIHVVRALSHEGRQKAIGVLMDILNDELRRLRATPSAPAAPDYTAEKPRVKRARAVRVKPK